MIVVGEHARANLLNDYCDAEGSDSINQNYSLFNGGSRCIQKGLLRKEVCLKAAICCYVMRRYYCFSAFADPQSAGNFNP